MVSIGYKVRCAMGKQLGYISPTCFQQAPHYEVQNKVRHMTEEGRGTYCREGKRGNGAEKGKGKPEGRGRGGAEETCGGAPSQTARPKGSSPQGMSGSITKSECSQMSHILWDRRPPKGSGPVSRVWVGLELGRRDTPCACGDNLHIHTSCSVWGLLCFY